MAHRFSCANVGTQYRHTLKDIYAASDLVEGLLKNKERPPAFDEMDKNYSADQAILHFNEVDECSGLDSVLTYRLWNQLVMSGENTLYNLL